MGVSERLVYIREKNGMTRKRLAEELGRPYRTVTNYENGEREPSQQYIVEFAEKFGVSTDYIYGRTDIIEGKYSAAFRRNLRIKLEELGFDISNEEPEVVADFRRLQDLTEKTYPLSLEEVCNAVDVLGADVTLDEMVGWEKSPEQQKKSLGMDEAIPRDKDEQEIIQLTRKLHPQQQTFLLAWLKTAIELNRGTVPAAQESAVGKVQESTLQD